MRNRAIVTTLVLVAAPAALGCGEEIESDLDASVAAQPRIALASTAATPERRTYRTHVYSEYDTDVFSRLADETEAGYGAVVETIHVELGDRVSAGQLLATLDDDEASVEVEAARVAAEEAEANLRRVEELKARELVSPSEYEAAQFAVRRASAALERSELWLSRTRIRAPFAGVVSRRYVRVGQLVRSTEPLFRVTAMAPLRARLLVPEDRGSVFRPGARVHLSGSGGAEATAVVRWVGPTVDPASGTYEVIVEVADSGDLRPGAEVTAELTTVGEAAGR